MFQSIKHFYSETLRALDGEIGHVKDFYFDDTHWAVRYLVAVTSSWSNGTVSHVRDFTLDDESLAIRRLVGETGHWLSGKEVLISPSQIDGISYGIQGFRSTNKRSHPAGAGTLRSSDPRRSLRAGK